MEAKAILRNARIAPRKVQIVLDLIRGKDYDVAMATVKHTPKAASEYLEKLLKSAAHNAENNHNMDKNNLYVAECYVCPGPIMKRIMPRHKAEHIESLREHHTLRSFLRKRNKLKEEVNYGTESKSTRTSCRCD